jgi:2'-5' RNA ligase
VDTLRLQDFVDKLATIGAAPEQRFTYVPLPLHVQSALKMMQASVVPAGTKAQDIDHITLVYSHDAPKALEPANVDRTVKALREAAEGHAPIEAKVQGWAYFDGVRHGGKPATALVALVDAPGLAELHVDLKSTLKLQGHPAADTHGFNPHVTLAYLNHGQRIPALPKLPETNFTIDKVMFANRESHGVLLKGSMGGMAAKAAAAESTDFNLMDNRGVSPPPTDVVPPIVNDAPFYDDLYDFLAHRMRMRAGLAPVEPVIPFSGLTKGADLLPGGKGDSKSRSAFDAVEFAKGQKVEREHTSEQSVADEITKDHLTENPKYYSKLQRAGLADELDAKKACLVEWLTTVAVTS